ncbi:MAG: anion permease [Clostridiales Family XIII bacterium]|jgi:anion transporter|nr:anion permease [Clostridiales Family XIII bacterium]
MRFSARRAAFSATLLLALWVGLSRAFQPELPPQGHNVLMILIATIGLWIFKPLKMPFSVSSAFFLAASLISGVQPAAVFSGFAGGAVWSLIPALFFGFALAKTGLGRRIAYFGMKSVRVSYPSLLLMWTLIGLVLSILTPSITVRVVIVTPIALDCVRICGLPERSKERSLILMTAWAMAIIPGIGWLSGSLTGPIISGLFAATPGLGPVGFSAWLSVSLLPVALASALLVVAGYAVMRPSGRPASDPRVFADAYRQLGAVSGGERATGAVLVACFAMFVTSSLHHVPDTAVCLLGFFALAALGVIEPGDIGRGISWDMVVFVGTAMGFGQVFAACGVSAWLSGGIVGAIAPIAQSPWTLVAGAMAALFLWRFVDIAVFVPTMAIVVAVLPEISASYGISPLVWIPMLSLAQNAFFMSYTNLFASIAENVLGEGAWTRGHLARYGLAYFAASLVATLASVPYWKSIGMFG